MMQIPVRGAKIWAEGEGSKQDGRFRREAAGFTAVLQILRSLWIEQCGVYFHPSKQQSLAGDPGEENATYGIFGINVDFSRSVQCGFFFHPKDKDLSLGTPAEEKAT